MQIRPHYGRFEVLIAGVVCGTILVEKAQLISRSLTRFLYNASISYVMARTRLDIGSYRFGLVEDLSFTVFQRCGLLKMWWRV
jgi:Na+/citrate or Na+/malate symporter